MTTDGGGWTLVLVSSDDSQDTWTWFNRNYLSTDTTVFGSLSSLNQDFKSEAYHQAQVNDVLFIHYPSGIWAEYDDISLGENMGDIVGDLNRRRGQVNSMDDRAGAKVVKAEVPLSEMFGYVTSLRTLSSGRATSTMEFAHYSETPSSISETVISEVNGNSDKI